MAIIIHMPSVKRGKKRTGSSSDAPKDPTLENSKAPLVQPESLRDNSAVGDHEDEEIYEDDEDEEIYEDDEDEQIYEDDEDDVGEGEEEEEEEEVPNHSSDSLPYDEEEEEEEEEELENDEEGDNLVHIEEFDNEEQFDEEDEFVGGINEQIEEEFDEWEEYNEEILEVEWGYNNQVEDEGEDDGDGSVVDPVEFSNELQFDDHLSFRKRGLPVDFDADRVSRKRRRYSI